MPKVITRILYCLDTDFKALELLASRGLTSHPNRSKDCKVDGRELELGLLGGQLEGLWDLGDPPSPEREDNMPFEIIDGTKFGIEEPREGNIRKAVEVGGRSVWLSGVLLITPITPHLHLRSPSLTRRTPHLTTWQL